MKNRAIVAVIAVMGFAGCVGPQRIKRIEAQQNALIQHANMQNAINQKLSDDIKLVGALFYQHANDASVHTSTGTVQAMIHPKPVKKANKAK